MSHFLVGVIIEKDAKDDVEAKISEVLAPYDENLEVKEYDTDCWCIGQAARTEAMNFADETCGTVSEIRNKFANEFSEPLRQEIIKQIRAENPDINDSDIIKVDEKWDQFDVKLNEAWKTEDYQGGWQKVYDEKLESLPNKNDPDKDCEECNGSGIEKSTYNPESKWDWWQIGGRWDDGDKNIIDIADLEEDPIVYAIVDIDGSWNKKGTMGWWGMSSNEKDDWKEIVKALIEKNKDKAIVFVDCHI